MSWLSPDVVAAVARHMNDDHRADLLVMVGPLAPEALDAEVAGLDLSALHVRVSDPDGSSRVVSLPWPGPLTERADIRKYVVQMYEQPQGEM